MTIVYAFTVYCLTCSGIEPLSQSDHYFSTYEICVREAYGRIREAFPAENRFDVSCLKHPVSPNDVTKIQTE